MKQDQQKTPRPYASPKLASYGKVSELTLSSGRSNGNSYGRTLQSLEISPIS